MTWYYLSCCILPVHRDQVIAAWSGLGMMGCREEETEEGLWLTSYFSDETTLQRATYETMRHGVLFSPIETGILKQQDWNRKWREQVEPVKMGERFWASPSWRPPAMNEGEFWIRVEPKMAFGTGHHESTRLAVAALEKCGEQLDGKRLLDIGAGSGVLCFAGRFLGASLCLGVEIDPDCTENLAENLRENPGNGVVGFLIGSVDTLAPGARFDMVVMNVILTEGQPVLRSAVDHLNPGGKLCWSGLLLEDRTRAVTTADDCDLAPIGEIIENEWCCLILEQRASNGENK